MIKITNLEETDQIQPLMLKTYIAKKMTAMMQEYQVENLDDIGCFIVLEPEEFTDFPIGEMEFVEMLFLEESMFLHGVRIINDSYGEDIYLPVEVVRCCVYQRWHNPPGFPVTINEANPSMHRYEP